MLDPNFIKVTLVAKDNAPRRTVLLNKRFIISVYPYTDRFTCVLMSEGSDEGKDHLSVVETVEEIEQQMQVSFIFGKDGVERV